MPVPVRRHTLLTIGLLAAAFGFRLFYGLSMRFWTEDERQVYLIGLRSFARGEWPYFGADVVWTGGQLPGALQGLLIRTGFAIWPRPEAPVVLLNVLSFGALAAFAWYLCRRFSDVPRWLIWAALMTLPWTLNFSTHVVNPSYVLPGSICFFLGFLEGAPAFRRGHIPFAAAWMLMGAGLFFVMQIHMSWILLPPYVLVAAIGVMRARNGVLPAIAGFAGGAMLTGSLLVPTLLRYGIGAGHVQDAIVLHGQNPWDAITTMARILSFASFETNRFLGVTTADRALMLWRQLWLVPFVALVTVAGILQPLWMVWMAVRPVRQPSIDWTRVRLLVLGTVALVFASFFLSVRWPQAHAYYVVFPVAALFACACWDARVAATNGRLRVLERVAAMVLVSGVMMHAGLAIDRWPRESLYADRGVVEAAIGERNDRLLGDRRATLMTPADGQPRPVDVVKDAGAWTNAQAMDDLYVVSSVWQPVSIPLVGQVSRFNISVANRGHAAAWLDLRFATAYLGARGELLTAREGVIKQLLQPGQTRTWPDIADGTVPEGAVTATLTIVGAEKCIPVLR
jgi:hypothetical protein